MHIQNNFNSTHRYNFSGATVQTTNVASLVDEKNMVDTFIKMVKMDTTSDSTKAQVQTPSTDGQKEFANWLKNVLQKLGVEKVELDENCFLTGQITSNSDKPLPKIALLAHMDTKSVGENVQPNILQYSQGNIKLKNGFILDEFYLREHKNKKIITTDGTTVLGADDKAGIAEILEAIRILNANPHIKHPEIKIAFTPDEECGCQSAISKFDIEKFDADLGYTIDGDYPHYVEKETYFPIKILPQVIQFYRNRLQGMQDFSDKIDEYEATVNDEKLQKISKYASIGLERSKLTPKVMSIRGVTDGSFLSMNGLPTVNLGTGGYLGHTQFEFAVVEDMKKCVENIVNILSVWAEKG